MWTQEETAGQGWNLQTKDRNIVKYLKIKMLCVPQTN